MCRNIRTLYNFEPPASSEEIGAAALQYVRKISGFTKPSQANAEAFDRAVAEITAASARLIAELETAAPPKDREVEAAKARARAAERYGRAAGPAGNRADPAGHSVSLFAGRGFPDLRLSTGELTLRPLRSCDAPAIAAACRDPLNQRWLPLPRDYSEAQALAFVESARLLRESGDGIRCAITLAATEEFAGLVGLKRTDWLAGVTDIGYWSCAAHRGRGLVTQAARALSHWALELGIERVELRAAPDNLASNRVALGAGFTFEGRMRNAGYLRDGRCDLNLYSLVREDR